MNSLSEMPLNVLARDLWSPVPAVDAPLIGQMLAPLQAAAQEVIAQNYPEAELPAQLLTAAPAELAGLVQALLAVPAGKLALTTVAELATGDADALANRLLALPANHPLVYALTAWYQAIFQRFLLAEIPAALVVPSTTLLVRGQLLGATGSPLANFSLQPTQTVVSREGAERSLGELRTGPDGRFELSVARDLYLDDDDAVAEAPVSLRALVYYPGQATTGEPALTLVLTATEEVAYSTDLSPTAPAPASRAVDNLALPSTLSQLLAEQGISSLAGGRAAAGFERLYSARRRASARKAAS